jgi:hypothetical protein
MAFTGIITAGILNCSSPKTGERCDNVSHPNSGSDKCLLLSPPPELRTAVYGYCDVPSLCALMRTGRVTRAETSGIFWGVKNIRYLFNPRPISRTEDEIEVILGLASFFSTVLAKVPTPEPGHCTPVDQATRRVVHPLPFDRWHTS